MDSTTIKGSKTTVSTKYIYDMPGVEAIQTHVTSSSTHPSSVSSIANTKESKASSLRSIGLGSYSAISRPNMKNRPIPAPLKPSNGFQIFRDGDSTTSSVQNEGDTFVAPRVGPSKTLPERLASEVSHMDTMRSPVASLQAADRRARELTESPLADVTLAYTGRGRFSNSPTVSSFFIFIV